MVFEGEVPLLTVTLGSKDLDTHLPAPSHEAPSWSPDSGEDRAGERMMAFKAEDMPLLVCWKEAEPKQGWDCRGQFQLVPLRPEEAVVMTVPTGWLQAKARRARLALDGGTVFLFLWTTFPNGKMKVLELKPVSIWVKIILLYRANFHISVTEKTANQEGKPQPTPFLIPVEAP